jgi:hypothetical protein
MKRWQIIKTLISDTLADYHPKVKIGIWPGDDVVYFSVEGLKPEDFVDSDTWEFPVSIADLEQIVKEAKG